MRFVAAILLFGASGKRRFGVSIAAAPTASLILRDLAVSNLLTWSLNMWEYRVIEVRRVTRDWIGISELRIGWNTVLLVLMFTIFGDSEEFILS